MRGRGHRRWGHGAQAGSGGTSGGCGAQAGLGGTSGPGAPSGHKQVGCETELEASPSCVSVVWGCAGPVTWGPRPRGSLSSLLKQGQPSRAWRRAGRGVAQDPSTAAVTQAGGACGAGPRGSLGAGPRSSAARQPATSRPPGPSLAGPQAPHCCRPRCGASLWVQRPREEPRAVCRGAGPPVPLACLASVSP